MTQKHKLGFVHEDTKGIKHITAGLPSSDALPFQYQAPGHQHPWFRHRDATAVSRNQVLNRVEYVEYAYDKRRCVGVLGEIRQFETGGSRA